MTVKSITLTGDGSVHTIAALANIAGLPAGKMVYILPSSSNAGVTRIGSTATGEVTSSSGFPVPKGTPFLLPVNGADDTAYYDLTLINIYIANNETVDVLYGG